MAAPYAPAVSVPAWQGAPEMRSTTPATSNAGRQPPGHHATQQQQQNVLSHPHRYASAPRMGGGPQQTDPNAVYATNRSMTPSRLHIYNRPDDTAAVPQGGLPSPSAQGNATGPSSTGLIRLSLKKPMGIVFEPMYDPNQPSAQRGVRICDLPRTGAAALSRKLQVGDELLQINDKTVSRLTFDEIMDFIIDADPDCVNLLFRRPRKETLQARQGVQQKLQAAANKDAPSKIKWQIDDEKDNADGSKKKKDASSNKKSSKKGTRDSNNTKRNPNKRGSLSEEEETLQSSLGEAADYRKPAAKNGRKKRGKKDPYESESFLDLLIDTICSNSNVCRDMNRKDDYISDEEGSEPEEASFDGEEEDESTYVTYEESVEQQRDGKATMTGKHAKAAAAHAKNKKKLAKEYQDEEDEEEDEDQQVPLETPRSSSTKRKDNSKLSSTKSSPKNGLMSNSSKQPPPYHHEVQEPPLEPEAPAIMPRTPMQPQQAVLLGLQQPAVPPSAIHHQHHIQQPQPPVPEEEEQTNPGAPIREVEYDERIDHGADVSVMESLGGPSLLIEKQRAAQLVARQAPAVPAEIMDSYGLDYPIDFGKTRAETIQNDPLRFYTFVVKSLLEQHEPEKVRLLDKLLAKYKGREDHLVQKLSVRYANRETEQQQQQQRQQQDEQAAMAEAVQKSKSSPLAAHNVHAAQERLREEEHGHQEKQVPAPFTANWPEKEEKEQEVDEEEEVSDEEEEGSDEYSRGEDSVDGTSPAVIAQVSELLNYVYGKTSVPGQIDRVSTIMRAYEGREAVLLELLETKALIKANKEKENAEELPAFLRNSPQVRDEQDDIAHDEGGASRTPNSQGGGVVPPQVLHDDISSMSGVSSPQNNHHLHHHHHDFDAMYMPATMEEEEEPNFFATPRSARSGSKESPIGSTSERYSNAFSPKKGTPPAPPAANKKKKGIFGGLFKKKERAGSRLKN